MFFVIVLVPVIKVVKHGEISIYVLNEIYEEALGPLKCAQAKVNCIVIDRRTERKADSRYKSNFCFIFHHPIISSWEVTKWRPPWTR